MRGAFSPLLLQIEQCLLDSGGTSVDYEVVRRGLLSAGFPEDHDAMTHHSALGSFQTGQDRSVYQQVDHEETASMVDVSNNEVGDVQSC